jgi:hypothetical protein
VPQKARNKGHLGHSGNSCVRLRPAHVDQVWARGFIHDRTTSGRSLNWLSVVDKYTRESWALVAGRSITAEDVLEVLADLFRRMESRSLFPTREFRLIHSQRIS